MCATFIYCLNILTVMLGYSTVCYYTIRIENIWGGIALRYLNTASFYPKIPVNKQDIFNYSTLLSNQKDIRISCMA